MREGCENLLLHLIFIKIINLKSNQIKDGTEKHSIYLYFDNIPSSSTSCASVVTSTVAIHVSCTNDDGGRHQRSVVVVSASGVSLVDRRLSLSSVAGRILATHNSNAVDTYH